MSNIAAARANIKAEIANLQAQIVALQKSLESLDKLEVPTASVTTAAKAQGKRGRKPKAEAIAPAKRVAPATAKGKASQKPVKKSKEKVEGELPSTGGDYWPNLITSEPQSASEVLQKAIDGLGFTPTKAQLTKLANRETFALNSLVKEGRIQDSGKGRERRYFIA